MNAPLLRFKKLQGALSGRLPSHAMQLEGEVLRIRATEAEQLAAAMRATAEQGLTFGEVVLGPEEFDSVQLVDPHSCLCEVGAHLPLAVLEARLKASGLTLGPLSPGAAKLRVGEWLEGPHASLRPVPGGRLEPAALALEAALWSGLVYRSHRSPRSASGPDLDHLLLGGRGAIGRITRATLRVAPRPTTTEARTLVAPSGAKAVAWLQRCLFEEAVPVSARVTRSARELHVVLRFEGLAFRVHRDAARAVKAASAMELRERPGEAEGEEGRAASEAEVAWPALASVLDGVAPSEAASGSLELHRIARESVVAVSSDPLAGTGIVDLAQPPAWPGWWAPLVERARGAS